MSNFGFRVLGFGSFPNRTSPYTVEFLVVAGGGGSARNTGQYSLSRGGGAGGAIDSTLEVTPSVAYTVTVGAGGG